MTHLSRDLVLKWIDERLEFWHFRGASALITLKDLRVAIAQGALSPSPAGQDGDEDWPHDIFEHMRQEAEYWKREGDINGFAKLAVENIILEMKKRHAHR